MDLIKSFVSARLSEDAAAGSTSATAFAVAPMPLFATMMKRPMTDTGSKKKDKKVGKTLKETIQSLSEDGNGDATSPAPSDDTTGIISKLKALETKERTDYRDVTMFGLEDSEGGTVRVSVSNEQAEEFQKALQSIMADDDQMEIPELLFKLKDKFDILNVEWPEVQEDEEEIQTVDTPEPDPNAPPPDDLDNIDGGDQPPPDQTSQTQDLLTQVIDMMKADAEARKAEAEARKSEARAREGELALQQTNNKVKQEEQLLDMESFEKSQKEAARETKRLAKLARWKQGVDKSEDDSPAEIDDDLDNMGLAGTEENEEISRSSHVHKKVQPIDIANFILKRVK